MADLDFNFDLQNTGPQVLDQAATPDQVVAPVSADRPLDFNFNLQSDDRRLQTSLDIGAQSNPDEAAKALDLATKADMPVDVVERNLPDFDRRQQVRDTKQALQDRPATTAFMANPDNAKVAWDDVANLASVERAAKEYTAAHPWDYRAAEDLKAGVLQLRNNQLGLTVFSNTRNNAVDQSAITQAQGAIDKATADPALSDEQRAKKIQHWTDRKNYHQSLLDQRTLDVADQLSKYGANRSEAEAIAQNPYAVAALQADSVQEFAHWFKKDPVGFIANIGLRSIPNMAPGLLLGAAGGAAGGPVGFAAGLGSGSAIVEFANTLIEQIEAHGGKLSDPESVRLVVAEYGDDILAAAEQRGAIIGAFDAATGWLAALRLLPRGSTPTRAVIFGAAELAAQTLLQMLGGGGGEYTAEVLGGEKIRPGEIMAEAVGELITGPIEIATAGLSVTQDVSKANNAQRNKRVFEAMGESAQASKVRERLPAKYREFVERVREAGPVKSVFVDPEALTTLMQSGVVKPGVLPGTDLAARIDEARQTGQSVEVSLEDYQTYLAGTDAGQALMGDIKFAEDDFTVNQADQFNLEYRGLVEAELRSVEARADEDRKEQDPFDRIYAARVAQLTAAGASPVAAATQAKLHEAHARAFAGRYGVDPETMAASVEVRGPLPESLANPIEPVDLTIERARRGSIEPSGKLFGESLQELARRLGIKDDRGDLAGQEVDKGLRPFERKMLRENGTTIDSLIEEAVESGYFPQAEDVAAEISRSDMIEALLGPPRYVEGRGNEAELSRVQAAQDLIETLDRLGVDLNATNEEIKAALDKASRVEGGRALYQAAIDRVLKASKADDNPSVNERIGHASPWLIEKARENGGLDIEGFSHSVNAFAFRHIRDRHGNKATEVSRGLVAITDDDLRAIPDILSAPDTVIFGTKNSQGRDQVVYLKKMSDGTTLYLEEIRTGRRELATVSMRKYPATTHADSILSTLVSTPKNDGGDKLNIVDVPKNTSAVDGQPDGRVFNQSAATAAFRLWFGDSKVVDADGNPRVVYHGTGDDITAFDLDHPNRKDTGWLGTGVYLTTDPALASSYSTMKSRPDGGNVMPLYARLVNPYYATLQEKQTLQMVSHREGAEAGREAADQWTRDLQAKGHDGVILEYKAKDVGAANASSEIVVFDPAGVKSAIGNNGAFSQTDPRVLNQSAMPATVAPPFYSALTRAIDTSTQGKASPGQWLAFINGLTNKGVKSAEIEWSGVKAWLDKQPGPVTKADLLAFLRENEVKVKEVLKQGARDVGFSMSGWIEEDPDPDFIKDVAREIYLDEAKQDIADEEDIPVEEVDEEEAMTKAIEMSEQSYYENPDRPSYQHVTATVDGVDYQYTVNNDGGEIDIWPNDGGGDSIYLGRMMDDGDIQDKIQADIEEKLGADSLEEDNTKFGEYTLPGGENYRELLLTLPGGRRPTFEEWYDKTHVMTLAEESKREMSTTRRASLMAIAQDRYRRDVSNMPAEGVFTSGHFDEPNVLAHVRFNERVDAKGKRTLFVEEVQSDWHQKGRKKGYRVPPERAAELEARRLEIEKLGGEIAGREGSADAIPPELKAEWVKIMNELQPDNQSRVPDAPLKTTWHELTMKRMLRWAAENGYDQLAWTTGEMQNERYDLSKQVDTVDVINHVDGGRFVDIRRGGNSILDARYDSTGKITDSGHAEFIGKELSDVLGKELSDKVMAVKERSPLTPITELPKGYEVKHNADHPEGQQWTVYRREYTRIYGRHATRQAAIDAALAEVNQNREAAHSISALKRFEGLDLKIGGEGMKGFYDKILPAFLSKYAKKWKAKVGTAEIKASDGFVSGEDVMDALGIPGGEQLAWWRARTGEERTALINEHRVKTGTTTVHAIPITDAMRESVLQGQPLFQRTGADQPRGSIQFFPDGKAVINLFEGHDLSTFLHESGHLFVNMLANVAETNEKAAADLSAMMAFAGVETIEGFNQVEAQEKLARAFEAYLREGKAPSVELQAAFSRFRAWLINIYRSIVGLDVAIDDSIRGVFDRMLATDDEIAAAQRVNEFVANADIAELMNDSEKAAYSEAAQVATDQAVFALEKEKITELARETTEAWKAEAETLRVDVAKSVDNLPVYRAMDDIRDPSTSLYLSREAVDDMVGKEGARALPSGLTRVKGGIHPDFLAEEYGFSSGDEMLFALMNAEKNKPARAAMVKGLVEDQMNERHGSLNASTAQAAEKASEIVHSDERGKFLAMELRALAREAKGQATPASVAKAAAVRIIASKKVKDAIQVGKYAGAEVSAAKAVTRALLKKDIAAATEAKRQQLLNHYLFMEARKARDELDAMLRYFHKFDKRSKGLDAAYAEQIDGLLERYDFHRAVSLKEIGRRKSLAAFVAEQNDADQPVSIDEKLLTDARKQHYKDTSLEELRGLRDAVKHLDHLGRLKNKLLSAQAKRDLDDLVGEMVGSIEENWKGKTRKRTQSLTPFERRSEWWQSKASLRRIEFMLRELDGFKPGPMQETVFGIVASADDNLQERRLAAANEIRRLFNPFKWREVKGFFTRKAFIPEIGDSLTKESILAVALNMGTIDNREKLMKGTGWSDEGLAAVLSKVDEKDWQLIQGIWDYLETFWPETVELDKATKGVAAPKVEAEAVETPFGTLRGGYYPIKYDSRASDRAQRNTTEDIYKRMMMGDIGRPTTNQGRTKERLAPTMGLKIRLDLGTFFEAIDETMHDLAFRKAAIDVTKILHHPKLVDALKDTVGEPRVDMLRDWLKDSIAGDMTAIATPADKIVGFVRNRTTIMAMGYKLSTALIQPFGFTQTVARFIEDAGVAAGLTYSLKGLRAFYGSPAKMRAAVAFVRERSSFMRTRPLTWDRDVHAVVKNLKKGPLSYYEDSFFWHIAKMQLSVDYPTWLGAYHWSLDNQPGKGEKAAAAYADSVVRMTQGAGNAKDLAPIQKGSETTRMFNMFMTYFSAMNNMLIDQGRQLKRNPTPRQVAAFSTNIFMLTIVPSVLVELLYSAAGVAGPDDDESWGEYLGKAWFLQLVGGLPIIRDWLSHAVGGYPYELSPVASTLKKAMNVTDQIGQGELDRGAVNAALTAAGLASPVPIPTGQIMIMGDYFVDLYDGEKEGFNPIEAFVKRDYHK